MPAPRPAQPIKVFSMVLSGHAHRVRLMLSLLDLPYDVIEVDLMQGAHKKPDYLARNPHGEVPAIEDGDVTLYDSNAILVYLATKYDDGRWIPRDPVGAAVVQRWLGFVAGPITYGAHRARIANLFNAPVDHDGAKQVAAEGLAKIESELTSKDFAIGDTPTIADVAGYAYVALAPEGDVSLEPYPNVRAWLARMEALPGFVPMQRSI